ncbi:hypothetical protein BCR32DRAFT_287832 [Anaeromyces robustus]|uniref:Uncharacterized protein n=1 Tax=Anaeromyces robustus TaxID=1754192 RepID=A0A1Y1VPZ1_9FUNG|nr:hypothetical protein BCR32DRAFT_287832 [Anaeromyces robustus]|eukprot:ORX63339.1 hypothetical protein BCR32DRAFT_287832 [Anaeromyces robustus]
MKNKNNFKIGDLVKIRNHQRTKLEPYFLGPYIIKDISWNTVQLQDAGDGTKLERNFNSSREVSDIKQICVVTYCVKPVNEKTTCAWGRCGVDPEALCMLRKRLNNQDRNWSTEGVINNEIFIVLLIIILTFKNSN